MATATWRYRGDPGAEQPAALAQFSNGRLQRAEAMRFTVYRNASSAHPRKKHQRILVSESERLSYVGNNFDSVVKKYNSLCRYGLLAKWGKNVEVESEELLRYHTEFLEVFPEAVSEVPTETLV